MLWMAAIRAHFDGKVIVPDEPIDLAPDSPVYVWFAQDAQRARDDYARSVREYYQSQSPEDRADDDAWGEGLSRDFGQAWDAEQA